MPRTRRRPPKTRSSGARSTRAAPLVILTGLSGSGKASVLRTLEDLGYYCVDNLPVALIPTFSDLAMQSGQNIGRTALLVDAREGEKLAQQIGRASCRERV